MTTASAPDAQPGRPDQPNRRSRLKSDRRLQLLSAAERLFAERGFLAVRLEDIGAAAGVSGPAIYRHFPNKESMLVELLVGISARLLAGARDVSARGSEARVTLDDLIDFHLDFALGEPDLIRIQDRDLAHLPAAAAAGPAGASAAVVAAVPVGAVVARLRARRALRACPPDRAARTQEPSSREAETPRRRW